MKRITKIAILTFCGYILTFVMLFYQHSTITKMSSETGNDTFLTFVSLAILLAIDAFVVLECIYMAYGIRHTDGLTQIPNILWINRKGGKMYAKGKLQGVYTLIFVNIKDCKYLNEKYGNESCDKVIRGFAEKLAIITRKKGYAGRMGGDNFMLIVKNEYVDEIIEAIKLVKVNTIDKKGDTVVVDVQSRAGIAPSIEGVNYKETLNRCTTALARARRGEGAYLVFDEQMRESFVKEKSVLDGFRAAIENEEFEPYFQPKVDLKTRKLCGAEALSRWIKNGKVVPPMEFIPVLEEAGSIMELDYYIFDKVCKKQKEWIESGIDPVCLSINFSKLHLDNKDFAKEIIAIKDKYQLEGRLFEIELTESSGCEDYNLLAKFAKEIKKAGFRISIDDFGTGYSSLSMLQKFEASSVKLDKSFLDSAFAETGAEKNRRFMTDIISVIKRQNEETVCEGVETEEQLNFVSEAGCDIVQGFYFDKPLPIAEFEKRLVNKSYK